MDEFRVLVVDDHRVVREGLRAFLDTRPGMVVVGEAGDGEAAGAEAARLQPDVILMDLVIPVLDGLQAIGRIRGSHPRAPSILLTSFTSTDPGLPAPRRGAPPSP